MPKDLNEVKFLRSSYLPVLPLVYDDAISYIEQLGKITKKINEVIESINNIELDVLGQAYSYTDGKISVVNERINNIINDVAEITNELREENERFLANVTIKVNELEDEVDNFNDNLIASVNAVNERTDMVVKDNNEKLLAEMRTFLSQILVTNYITGAEMSIQDMFDFLCKYHLTDALTYTELIAKSTTYAILANYSMTYTDLITNGGAIIQ